MGPLGWQETLVIFVLVLLLFGPKKLPEVGRNIAKAINEFRRASNELKDTWHREMANLERETSDIRKEADSISQATSGYTSTSDYNYDSSYDYGSYGYPESYEAPSTTSDSNPVSDSATQDADNTGETAPAVSAPQAAGGASPDPVPAPAPAAPPDAPSGEPAVR